MAKRTRAILMLARFIDVVAVPFTVLCGIWLKALRKLGLQHVPVSKSILLKIGVFPIRDHYYEPMFNPNQLRYSLSQERPLPGIDLNISGQLSLLSRFASQSELTEFPLAKQDELSFYYHNPSFGSGDAEFLYSLIRLGKPRNIVEIGSGFSTLMSRAAIHRNRSESTDYACNHICIEPYEQPWLEKLGIQITRRRVEECDPAVFASLGRDDILFIDSSHIIRPQGDVLFEYLELLPSLQSGVYIHIHDIFTPRDYPREWVVDENRLWNEQYMVEAFLSLNRDFQIVGALNFLAHNHAEKLAEKFPIFAKEILTREPGSLWLSKK
jgi:predicted O-methyltransferase YrrM